jgi:glycosyltransferase involved in cell wall biosynthesis
MKVIHFIAGIDRTAGGTTEYMRLLSSVLKNEVELIIATGSSDNPVVIEGVKIKFFNTSFSKYKQMTREFAQFLEEEKPQLVHINGIWSPQNWLFQKEAQQQGIKVIVSPHGMLEPWILANNLWKKKIAMFLYQKKAIERADYIHATAVMEAENITKLGFKNPIIVIPNGIDSSEVKQIKTVYGTLKMVFFSRIHPKKGIELLLEAWCNVDTSGWVLEIAGNGVENYIKDLALSAKKMTNVHFVGAQYGDDKWMFLQSADVMILPTHSENFGIVVAEALAVGVPVITTQGTPWEDLETYKCGWWIKLSVINLEKSIVSAFNTAPEVLKEMGSNGRKLIAEKYDIKTIGKDLVNLYKIL